MMAEAIIRPSVEKNIGKVGISAVRAPIFVAPKAMADVSRSEASVQFRLSMPWSKSSPRPEEVPVRRACFPSMLSMVRVHELHEPDVSNDEEEAK
ncbi:hypothetical protein KC320_g115 [Hortaea werneckii]|nr:hypothetical protein KC320_g115 [Hortaea werneckii]